MTLEELDAKVRELSRQRDELVKELKTYSAERNRLQAEVSAQQKLDNMSEQERTAIAHIIGASPVENRNNVGSLNRG